MVNNPEVILADESTGNLDPALAEDILSLLYNINKKNGITILMVTHSLLVAEFGNNRIKLSDGQIIN